MEAIEQIIPDEKLNSIYVVDFDKLRHGEIFTGKMIMSPFVFTKGAFIICDYIYETYYKNKITGIIPDSKQYGIWDIIN